MQIKLKLRFIFANYQQCGLVVTCYLLYLKSTGLGVLGIVKINLQYFCFAIKVFTVSIILCVCYIEYLREIFYYILTYKSPPYSKRL